MGSMFTIHLRTEYERIYRKIIYCPVNVKESLPCTACMAPKGTDGTIQFAFPNSCSEVSIHEHSILEGCTLSPI